MRYPGHQNDNLYVTMNVSDFPLWKSKLLEGEDYIL